MRPAGFALCAALRPIPSTKPPRQSPEKGSAEGVFLPARAAASFENGLRQRGRGTALRRPKGERIEIIQESQIDSVIPDGAVIRLGVKTEKINVFGEDGAHNLLEGVHDDNAV